MTITGTGTVIFFVRKFADSRMDFFVACGEMHSMKIFNKFKIKDMNMNQKGFANIVLIVVIVAIVAVGGYFALVKKPTPSNETNQPQQANTPVTPRDVTQKNVDDCNLISDSSFRSINQYESGLGPNGGIMGYWRIAFQGGKFQWGHSDVSESGTYICNNNVLQVKFFDHSITARYDGGKEILTWDGIEYKRVK